MNDDFFNRENRQTTRKRDNFKNSMKDQNVSTFKTGENYWRTINNKGNDAGMDKGLACMT